MFWKKIIPQKNEEGQLKRRLDNLAIKDSYIYLANILKIFIEDYGFLKSVESGQPLDKEGAPLPLYSYPAIEYLNSLDFSGKKVFEFGAGHSTLYWLNKKAEVISVENNPSWAEKLQKSSTSYNSPCKIILECQKEAYINSILEFEESFDLIIIDGGQNRFLCAQNAVKKIKKEGMVIIDNSDWYPNTTSFLKESLNFIQIDFYGFRPGKPQTSTTSILFSKDFPFKALTRQPNYALGGFIHQSGWDKAD